MTKLPIRNLSRHSAANRILFAGQHGFTLTELMVAVSIMAILASIALPSFSETLLSNKLRSYANDLVASAHLARSEAIKRNVVVTLCTSNDNATCSGDWKDGWVILAGGQVIYTHQAIDGNYLISEATDAETLLFQPTGVGSTQAALTVCRDKPTDGSQERVVTISATGKPSVAKTTAGQC